MEVANPKPPRRKSKPVTAEVKAFIIQKLAEGYMQQDIATMCGCNQGRISEVKTGKR